MTGAPKPTTTAATPPCLSDLRIDMWLAGDLAVAEAERARDHTRACAACAARVAAIEGARAADARGGGPDIEALRRAAALAGPARATARAAGGRGAWRQRWIALGATLAAGAAALVLVARGTAPPATTRSKGRAHVGFFVEHGGDVRRGAPGERVSPGDRVRFTATPADPARPGHLAIVGVDAARAATVYFPAGGVPDDVPGGADVELPRATLLDDTLGPEAVYAFFCARPLAPDALEGARAALAAHPDAPAPELPGCTVDRLDWVKVRAP
jgi:hypothetical protein